MPKPQILMQFWAEENLLDEHQNVFNQEKLDINFSELFHD